MVTCPKPKPLETCKGPKSQAEKFEFLRTLAVSLKTLIF